MYYLDYNNQIQLVNPSLFNNKKDFYSFLWKQSYNLNIFAYEKQDIQQLLLSAYHTNNT